MKIKKRLFKINLILIVLFLVSSFVNVCSADTLSNGLNILGNVGAIGLVGVLSEVLQVATLGIATAINAIISGLTFIANEGDSTVTGINSIVFNKGGITTASFFSFQGNTSQFAEKIGQMYMVVRNISIAILLFVLLYIGIRMAISTVADDKAKYKDMLKNWVVSLFLVFMLHFIIMGTFAVNDTLVNLLDNVEGTGKIEENYSKWNSDMLSLLTQGLVPVVGWDEVIVYTSFTVATLAMFIVYIKRVISLGFLIVIAPLISITYSIDKIGDNRSQALNTWLKEFMYTVLIQPFHCIIYIVFVNTSIGLIKGIGDNPAESILAIASVFFMLKAEGIVKTIFGLKADSMGDALKSGTMALAMATGLFKGAGSAAGGAAAGSAGGKMPVMDGSKTPKTKAPQGAGVSVGSSVIDAGAEATQNAGDKFDLLDSVNEMDTSKEKLFDFSKSAEQKANQPVDLASIPTIAHRSEFEPAIPKEKTIKDALKKAGNGLGKAGKTVGNIGKKAITGQADLLKRYSGGKSALQGAIKLAAVGGAGAFGAIAGGVLGDGSSIVATATAAANSAKGLYGKAENRSNEKQHEKNTEAFNENINEYAEKLRAEDPKMSNEEIVRKIMKVAKSDGDFSDQETLDMYKATQDYADSGKIVGEDKAVEEALADWLTEQNFNNEGEVEIDNSVSAESSEPSEPNNTSSKVITQNGVYESIDDFMNSFLDDNFKDKK